MTTQDVAAFIQAQYDDNYHTFDFQQPLQAPVIKIVSEKPLFRLTEYLLTINSLLDKFYPDHTTVDMIPQPSFYKGGGYIKNNEEFRTILYPKWIIDIKKIEFTKLYSSVMVQLIEDGEMFFSNSRFGELFTFYAKNFNDICEYLTDGAFNFAKLLLNFTYGYFNHATNYLQLYPDRKQYELQCNNIWLIPNKVFTMNQQIYDEFKNNIIYIDTDIIFIYEPEKIEEDLDRFLSQFKLYYTVSDYIDGMFFDKKKYMILENGVIKLRGISDYKTIENRKKKRIEKRKIKL